MRLGGFEWTAKRPTHNEVPGGYNEYVLFLLYAPSLTSPRPYSAWKKDTAC